VHASGAKMSCTLAEGAATIDHAIGSVEL
jgi:hypothetical protein